MKDIGRRTGAYHLVTGLLAVFLLACWSVWPQTAFAHASLTKAEPAADSMLEESPEEIRLAFSARLDSGMLDIKVYDDAGREVATEKAALSEDRKEMSVALPGLAAGSYTVSYRVMAADGHLLSDSYVFHIRKAAAGSGGRSADGGHDEHGAAGGRDQHDRDMDGEHEQHDHASDGTGGNGSHDQHGGHGAGTGANEGHDQHRLARTNAKGDDGTGVLTHGVKAVYLAAMLLFAGLALWRLWRGFASPSAGEDGGTASGEAVRDRQRLDAWQLNALRVFLLALIAWIGIGLPQLLDGWTVDRWASLARTSVGRLWGAQLVLAVIGLVVSALPERPGSGKPPRQRYAMAGLALLLLVMKSTSGHAAAAEPAAASIAADFIHLLAAALWAGGLLILLLLWRSGRERLIAFLQVFSRFAWISMLLLAASGFLMAGMMLPSLRYLQYSAWGTVLLVKIAVVLLVIPVAGVIRRQMKKRSVPAGKLVAADFTLALAIVVIAGVLSGLSPVPANEPLHWHVMGRDIHMTAEITPNAPGMNRFAVKVWLPEEAGEPERVQLQLVPLSHGDDPAPVDVPLAPSEDLGEADFFPGFTRFDYAGEGPWIAFPGDWQVRVLVTAPGGKSYTFTEDMLVY